MTAVRKDGWALRLASEDLWKYRKIVIAVLKQYGGALEFALDHMKRDR